MTMAGAGGQILITGGGGMIGAHLARRFVGDGRRVTVTTRSSGCPARLEDVKDRLQILRVDLRDSDSVSDMVSRAEPDVVIHLASTAFNPPPTVTSHIDVNVLGMVHLVESLRDRSGLKIVHAGSAAQYNDGDDLSEDMEQSPTTWLGISKTCAAAVLHGAGRIYGLDTVELRLFTPYGPWERPGRLIPFTILAALRGEAVQLGDGRPERDYVHIDDVVDAFQRAMTKKLPTGSAINVGSGVGRSVAAVASRILELMGKPVDLKIGTKPARADEIWKSSARISRAKELLDWRPLIDFDEGLRRTIDWLRTNRQRAESLT